MADKRMLIVDTELLKKIDENRGDMSRADFINLLIDSQLKEEPVSHNYITKEEFQQYERGIKELLRNFLEFFLSYGLELGKQPEDKTFHDLSQKLQDLSSSRNKTGKP